MLTQLFISLVLAPAHGFSPQDALSKPITFKHPVASVRTVVEALGTAAGVKLSAAPALKNEIVYINVRDAKLVDVMNRLGDLVASAWTEESGGFSLSRSAQKVKRDEDREYQQRLANYTKALAKKKEELGDPITEKSASTTIREMREIQKAMNSKNANYNAAQWKKYEKLSQQTPGRRAMIRLITAIGAPAFAAIKPTERVVFATSPTRMQRPLPNAAVVALNELAAEQSAWANAHASLPEPEMNMAPPPPAVETTEGVQVAQEVAADLGEQQEYISMHDPNGPKRPFKKPPAKAFLIAEPQNMGMELSQITLVLHVCDAEGNLLLSTRDDMNFEDMADMSEWSDPKKIFEVGKDEKPIELSPVIKDLEKMIGLFGMNDTAGPLSPETIDFICNPEKHELLDATNTPALDAVAEQKKTNVIASVPDMMFFLPMMGAMSGGMKLTPSVYLKVVSMPIFMQTAHKDGWLTIQPISPVATRRSRTDREALGIYLRRVRKEGRVTLDSEAEFALKSGDGGMFGLADMLLRVVLEDGNMGGPMFGGEADRKNYLKLYGSLSPAQRQVLATANGRIHLQQLSPFQQQLVTEMVYGPTPGWGGGSTLDLIPEESSNPGQEETMTEMPSFGDFSVATEPTQALPSGLNLNGYFTMKSATSDVIFASHADQRWGSYPQDIESIAFNLFAKDHPDKFPWITEQGEFVSFQAGRQIQLTFVFHFTSRLGMSGTLNDHQKLGKPGPITSLPPDVLKKINEAVKRQAEAHKEGGGLTLPDEDGDGPPPNR
ncbi:MAG: hypothetical protein HONBIEJF_02404 [Fimbriimonadaceae bacterium]|nr:hypothetical protein [Fimbriimonadaceae bacterium]